LDKTFKYLLTQKNFKQNMYVSTQFRLRYKKVDNNIDLMSAIVVKVMTKKQEGRQQHRVYVSDNSKTKKFKL
jgi:hypothetical protein